MEGIDIELVLHDYLEVKGKRGDQIDALCPFHKDTRPSFTVNVITGRWKCFTPDCEGFNGGELKTLLDKLGVASTTVSLRKEKLDINSIKTWHQDLLLNETAMFYLKNHCGYTVDTIIKFKLGWDGTRVTIPIFEDSQLVNIRKYSPAQDVKMLGIRGYNRPRVFPYENIHKDIIYLCAGEKDTILANQLGLNAITITAGEGIIPSEYLNLFKDKIVFIIHDVDEAGDKAIRKYTVVLRQFVKKVFKVTLPVINPNKDLTDFIVKEGHTLSDLLEIIDRAKPILDTTIEEKDSIPIPTTLKDIRKPEYYGKNLEFFGLIVGRDSDPFMIPRRVEFICLNAGSIRACKTCLLMQDKHTHEYGISDIIRFINMTDKALLALILDIAKMPACKCIETKNLEMVSLSSIQMEIPISLASREDVEAIATAIQGYVLNSVVEANQTYKLIGKSVVDSKTQQATTIIYAVEHIRQDIDDFNLGEEWTENLQKIFLLS